VVVTGSWGLVMTWRGYGVEEVLTWRVSCCTGLPVPLQGFLALTNPLTSRLDGEEGVSTDVGGRGHFTSSPLITVI
jgi:hypothetical protein